MRKTNKKIDTLLGAIKEVETKEFLNNDEVVENEEKELKKLIEIHLSKNSGKDIDDIKKLYELGHSLTGSDGIRKKLGAIDMEFFGRAYFSHYFIKPSPAFHKELDDIWHIGVLKGIYPSNKKKAKEISLKNGSRYSVAAPRGHAKSTTLTFKGTIHAVLYEYKHYPIIISDSSDQAEGFLDNIKVEFEENEKIIEDFGDLVGKVWRNNVILTSTSIKVEAIGSGKKIRGRKHRNFRPDLIILDDVENDELVRTKEQRTKLSDWFTKAVSKAGDYYTDIIYIGTLLHYDSLLAKTLKNPRYKHRKYKAVLAFSDSGLWDEWEKIYTALDNESREEDALKFFKEHKEEMIKGTKVLWNEKNSYYDLMVIKVSDGEGAFNSELQNEPINPDDCIFNEEWFEYYNENELNFRTSDFSFFGFVDPSLGKSKKSDYSAIVTLAKSKSSGYMYVLLADIERRHPDRIIEDVMQTEIYLRKTYGKGFTKIGAETNQFQWFLKEMIAKESAKRGLYLPLVEVNQNKDKTMRIETLQPDIKNRYIKFNKRHKLLLEQLMQFPMGSHDDGADALEGARSIAKNTRKFRILKKGDFGL
ncbi:MAG: phage terminase large subunit [Arcobacter sp.]|nr:phage terminase large subunit [Arcobacter sp.]